MKVSATYHRKLRTSRRVVFENVFDLEHVCVVHKRWFRNLRIRVQRPDYVEYILTSWFYGLEQETTVKGAPVDSDRYWYEFHTPLARMRVDGLMQGPDGDLTLTETITYEFLWVLAPVFWLLQPLFQRQKEDILRADSKLLERIYELDRQGFRRRELAAPKVVVYGGDGFFGRLVVEDLLKYSDAQIIIAGRHAGRQLSPLTPHIKFVESDLNDYSSILETIHGARVALCCAGPFQSMKPNLLRACIEKRVHYVDIADDRAFVEAMYGLSSQAEAAGIHAFVGCSVVPGLATLLCAYLRSHVPTFERTRICISPGTRHPRGPGSFLCLLSSVGGEFQVPFNGTTRKVAGWTEPESVQFPNPMGSRRVYMVVDIPDYFLQRHCFNTPTVEFRIGSELDSLNWGLSILRWVRQRLSFQSWRWFIPAGRIFIRLASLFGTSQGGVIVEVSGRDASQNSVKRSLCVFAAEKGEIIPAILPSVATQMILSGELSGYRGIVPPSEWLPAERLLRELALRNVHIVTKAQGTEDWAPFHLDMLLAEVQKLSTSSPPAESSVKF